MEYLELFIVLYLFTFRIQVCFGSCICNKGANSRGKKQQIIWAVNIQTYFTDNDGKINFAWSVREKKLGKEWEERSEP